MLTKLKLNHYFENINFFVIFFFISFYVKKIFQIIKKSQIYILSLWYSYVNVIKINFYLRNPRLYHLSLIITISNPIKLYLEIFKIIYYIIYCSGIVIIK